MTASRVEVQIRADDPAFDGHFPGLPILPGVVLLAEVLGAIERTTGQSLGALTIRSAKFHAPVSPAPPAPTTLSIDLAFGADVGFTVLHGEVRIASGSVRLGSDAAGAK